MAEIIDISPPVHDGLAKWPGLTDTRLTKSESFEKGDGVNVTDCSFCAHVGNHVDAPLHHHPDGIGIDKLELKRFMGKAYVFDCTHAEQYISAEDIDKLDEIKDTFDILLFRTKNSTTKTTWDKFDESLIYISPEAARRIVEMNIKTVVVDCLTVEKYGVADNQTHKMLLEDNNVSVVEGVDLRKVNPGYYWFICLPLNLKDADGAPARAILIKDDENDYRFPKIR